MLCCIYKWLLGLIKLLIDCILFKVCWIVYCVGILVYKCIDVSIFKLWFKLFIMLVWLFNIIYFICKFVVWYVLVKLLKVIIGMLLYKVLIELWVVLLYKIFL